MKIKTGLVGYGYWGINLLRNLVENPSFIPVAVCDSREDRLELVRNQFPEILLYTDYKEMIEVSGLDAVVIATHTSSHFSIAMEALHHNLHVFIEKPMVDNYDHARELVELAHSKQRTLLVDHTYLYNSAVRKIKEYLDGGSVGKVNYIDSTRINLGIYQQDVNVIWDLASHDIAMVSYLINERPSHVRAIGNVRSGHNHEDLAYIFLYYPSGLLVHITCSWASPVKIRRLILGGQDKMIIYDDLDPVQKLKVFDFEAIATNDKERQKILVDYRLGNITIPRIDQEEPLSLAMDDFAGSIIHGRDTFSNGDMALLTVNILTKAEQSLKSNGELISID